MTSLLGAHQIPEKRPRIARKASPHLERQVDLVRVPAGQVLFDTRECDGERVPVECRTERAERVSPPALGVSTLLAFVDSKSPNQTRGRVPPPGLVGKANAEPAS